MNLYNIIWIFIIAVLLKSIIKVLIFGKCSNKMNRAEYQLYLRTGKWKRKREEVFRKYGKECVLCGSNEHLIIHHRRYDNVGNEPMEDLSCRFAVVVIMLIINQLETRIDIYNIDKL